RHARAAARTHAHRNSAGRGNGQQLAGRGGIRLVPGRNGRHARAHLGQGARRRADYQPGRRPRARGWRASARCLAGRQRHRLSRCRTLKVASSREEVAMRKSDKNSATRRHVLKTAAAFGVTGLAGLPMAARAQAKGKIVVGTWGGDYARLLNKNIDQPILVKDGWEVIQDQAGDPERRSKMLAERRLPRGTTDIQGLSALNMYQMHDAGVIDQIDYGKL